MPRTLVRGFFVCRPPQQKGSPGRVRQAHGAVQRSPPGPGGFGARLYRIWPAQPKFVRTAPATRLLKAYFFAFYIDTASERVYNILR